jgi:hypothetical protein
MKIKSQDKWQQWESIINDYERSNMGSSTFCKERNLELRNFYYWKNRITNATPKKVQKRVTPFLPVAINNTKTLAPESSRSLPNAKWVAEFAAHFIKSLA